MHPPSRSCVRLTRPLAPPLPNLAPLALIFRGFLFSFALPRQPLRSPLNLLPSPPLTLFRPHPRPNLNPLPQPSGRGRRFPPLGPSAPPPQGAPSFAPGADSGGGGGRGPERGGRAGETKEPGKKKERTVRPRAGGRRPTGRREAKGALGGDVGRGPRVGRGASSRGWGWCGPGLVRGGPGG